MAQCAGKSGGDHDDAPTRKYSSSSRLKAKCWSSRNQLYSNDTYRTPFSPSAPGAFKIRLLVSFSEASCSWYRVQPILFSRQITARSAVSHGASRRSNERDGQRRERIGIAP